MSIFDELCEEFNSWHTRYLVDERESMMFAYGFANGLKAYIGAPESYKAFSLEPSEKRIVKYYVSPKKLIDHGDDTYTLDDPDNMSDLISRGQDGYWQYGISITLEIASNTWPKQPFGIPINFIIDDKICKMRITREPDGEFQFNISNADNYAQAYDFIVKLLFHVLRSKPSDQVQEKHRIGFGIPTAPKEQ